ncbi:hypothetical protein [uncultured Methanobrevibacter sp.]|uniref:hypothetical protein n=1 Tax=uncultured Methanobrevibacter sp. TaxID=253161 RepID=UPI002636930D|nr:hypothetical protein [uncultured Methanobrevibacter sp.]
MENIVLITKTVVCDMMNIYNSDGKINFDVLDEIYRKIRKIFTNVKTQKEYSLEELIEIYSNDAVFLRDLKVIEISMSEIADILEPIEILEKEYYNFLTIRRMINYILNEIKLFIVHLNFIEELLINFFNIIHQKLNSDGNYQELYSTFVTNLEKQKVFFFEKIFEFSDDYNDLIVDVTNVLW